MAGELINMVIVPMAKQGAKVIANNAPRIAIGTLKVIAAGAVTVVAKEQMTSVIEPTIKAMMNK